MKISMYMLLLVISAPGSASLRWKVILGHAHRQELREREHEAYQH